MGSVRKTGTERLQEVPSRLQSAVLCCVWMLIISEVLGLAVGPVVWPKYRLLLVVGMGRFGCQETSTWMFIMVLSACLVVYFLLVCLPGCLVV